MIANSNNSISFKFKVKITGQTRNDGTKDIEIMVPLKYLSNFSKTFKMPLIYCEFNLMLTWSENCFLVPGAVANQMPLFTLSYTKLYVAVETLSSHNAKLIEELKSG